MLNCQHRIRVINLVSTPKSSKQVHSLLRLQYWIRHPCYAAVRFKAELCNPFTFILIFLTMKIFIKKSEMVQLSPTNQSWKIRLQKIYCIDCKKHIAFVQITVKMNVFIAYAEPIDAPKCYVTSRWMKKDLPFHE